MSTLATATEVTFSIWAELTKTSIRGNNINWLYHDSSGSIVGKNSSGGNFKYEISLKGTSDDLRSDPLPYAIFETWHHVVVTLGTVDAKLYLNGQLQDTDAVGTGGNLGVNAFLGRYSSTSPVYATGGLLSNFAIFNSELSGPQVLTLFNGGTPETSISFSPVHHWKLNDINTGLNDIGSLASNNATRGAAAPGTVGSGPTTASSLVSSLSGTNNGATEYSGFVNTLAGDSTGMSQSNLVQSDLQTVAPYSKYAMNFDGTYRINLGLESDLNVGSASKCSTSLWFKKDDESTGCLWGYNYGDANGSGYYFWLNSGSLRIAVGKNGLTGSFGYYQIPSSDLPVGIWQNIVVIFNGTLSSGDDRIKVYHNGDLCCWYVF